MALVFEYRLTGVESLTRMQCINAVKRALRSMAEYWHEAFLWKRFTEIGYSEYNFRWRSAKYDKAKERRRGHTNPLVNTGAGRDEAMSLATLARIRVTRDKVTIPLPRKFNLSNPRGPKMSEEVRAVSRAEVRALEENLVWNIDHELAAEAEPSEGTVGPRVGRLKISGLRGGQRIVNPVVRRTAA